MAECVSPRHTCIVNMKLSIILHLFWTNIYLGLLLRLLSVVTISLLHNQSKQSVFLRVLSTVKPRLAAQALEIGMVAKWTILTIQGA